MADEANKAPALPWYPRDFAGDEPVQLMSLEEEGAYRRLLDHQWLHGSIPADMRQVAKVCKNVPLGKMRKLWPALSVCFVEMPDDSTRLHNRKLERVRQERRQYREQQSAAGKLGAEARWKDRQAHGGTNGDGQGDSGGEGDGGAMADSMAKPCLASAIASASASAQPKKQKKKPAATAARAGPDGGWPAEFAEMFAPIGVFTPLRVGKALKPVRDRYGPERTRGMLLAFVQLAPHQKANGEFDAATQAHQFCTPERFAQTAGFWYKQTEPLVHATA